MKTMRTHVAFFCVVVFLFFALPLLSHAQERDQTRDQDRTQDPTTHTGDEPLQDRDRLQEQDRDQLLGTTSTTTVSGTGAQVRERAESTEQLRLMIENHQEELQGNAEQLRTQIQNIVQNQNRMQVGTYAFQAAQGLLGNQGDEIATLARQLGETEQEKLQLEERIRTRSVFMRFFAGAPDDAVQALAQITVENQARLERIKQLLTTCDCDAEVRMTLQTQLQTMEEEQQRLRQFTKEESGRRGLFDILFGWVR